MVKVESCQGGFLGIVICESIVVGVKMVIMFINIIGNIYWFICYDMDVNCSFIFFYWLFLQWLCLVCQGDYIIGYSSIIGGSFVFVNVVYVLMDVCVEVGMVVFFVNNIFVSVVFSNVIVFGNIIFIFFEEVQEVINGISFKCGVEV